MFTLLQPSIKIENTSETPCNGCLSSDRNLLPLTNSIELFFQLLGTRNCTENESKMFYVSLCWECRALLNRICKFQLQIQQAQHILQQSTSIFSLQHCGTLSNLNVVKTHQSSTGVDDEINAVFDDKPSRIIVDNLQTNNKTDIVDDNDESYDFPLEDVKLENTDNNLSDHEPIPSKASKSIKIDEQAPKQRKWNLQIRKTLKKHMETIDFIPEANERHYSELKFNRKQFEKLLEKERKYKSYTSRQYRCKICVVGFDNESDYLDHGNKHKQGFGKFSCKPCNLYFKIEEELQCHQSNHYIGYKCNMCRFKSTKTEEQDTHVRSRHKVAYKCTTCGEIFGLRVQYSRHYSEAHMRYICDYCGKVKRQRHMIEAHIRRYHTSGGCKLCNRTFTDFTNLEKHYRYVHKMELCQRKRDSKPIVIENMYCVECDKQYETEYQYRKHLRNSAKHATKVRYKSVACPSCGKVFTRMNYMKNHFRVVHENTSKHRCALCEKNFVSPFSLRQHQRFVHDKIPLPKDKICTECGRGFSSNRVLTHHMRTHTGERPHACALCPATFARRDALNTHLKGHGGGGDGLGRRVTLH